MDDTNSTTCNLNDLDETEEDTFFCDICNEKFNLQQLFTCCQGHFFCKDCYKQEYYKGKAARCPHYSCNAWIDHARDSVKKKPNESVPLSNKMFPNGIYIKEPVSRTSIRNNIQNNISTTSLSKKPLFCPLRNCNKAVAVKAVRYHFECEHKNVASITTHLEARNGMEFSAADIKINDVLCICLIQLKKPEDCEAITQSHDFNENGLQTSKNPVLLIMATRILFDCPEKKYCENFCSCIPSEKYFLWASSNLTTHFQYTIALSSHCNKVRVKYFGPLMTLNEDYRMMCLQSKGLTLTEDKIRGLSSDFSQKLVLDILIHDTKSS